MTRRFSLFLLLFCASAAARVAVAEPTNWPDGAWIHAQQVLIQFTGVLHAPSTMHRTKEEARRRAMEVIARVMAGESFDSLVKEYSDDPVGVAHAGDLGRIGPGMLAPELEQAVLDLKEGEVSKTPVQTVFGFHVIRRLPSEHRIIIRHILVSYTGALRAKVGLKRTREQAKARAEELAAKLSEGASFDEIAKTSSDDVATASKGGLLGELRIGLTVPAFESVAFSLDPGETSGVIETPFGFHILRRDQ